MQGQTPRNVVGLVIAPVVAALAVGGWSCRGDASPGSAKPAAGPPERSPGSANSPGPTPDSAFEIPFSIDGTAREPLRIDGRRLPVRLRELVPTTGFASLHATGASGRSLRVDLAKFAKSPLLVSRDGTGLRLTLHRGSADAVGAPVMAVAAWQTLEARTADYQPESERQRTRLSIVRFGQETNVTSAAFEQLPATAWRDGPRELTSARRLSDLLGLAGPPGDATALEIHDGEGNVFTLRGGELARLDAILVKQTDSGTFNLKGPPRPDGPSKHSDTAPKAREWRLRDVRSLRLIR